MSPQEPDPRGAAPDGGRRSIWILGLDEEAAADLRDAARPEDESYVILARGIEPATAERIRAATRDGSLKGITLEAEPLRVYPQAGGGPNTTLAAHLLGFVNREGEGQYGVEQCYQDVLGGTPRVTVSERDASGQAVPGPRRPCPTGTPGEDSAHDRREPPAARRAGAARGVGRRPGQERVGRSSWTRTPARSTPRRRTPSYDANDYRGIAAADPDRSSIRSSPASTSPARCSRC